jgi:hypothetical protein
VPVRCWIEAPRRRVAAARSFVAALVALLACGCASLPADPAERALYIDLRTAVDTAESDGWYADWVRLPTISDAALRSICQVSPRSRDGLDRWIEHQIALQGGSAEQIYHAQGNRLGPASQALSLERARALLLVVKAHAEHDCPFFLQPDDARFIGVQGDDRRWLLLAETNAYATFVFETHTPAIGGGGRLLLGHGIGPQLTLAAGGELTAAATLLPSSKGSVDGIATVAVPVLLRLSEFSRFYDFELAPVARFQGGSKAFPPGARFLLSIGFSSLRTKDLMNYFALYLGYEYHFHSRGSPADNTIQGGTRIAFDLGL